MDSIDNLNELSIEQLREMLQEKVGAGISLSFPGKKVAQQIGRRVRPRVLRIIKQYGAGGDDARSRNFVIEGDNLQALASLYRERGQVDLVLTDPPYNTGNDFRYNDKWDKDPNDPELGSLVRSDDLARHTKWMRFMFPRLQMIHSMLKPSGVLAICIDHRELFRLGQMLDEIFGEENRLAIINWEKTAAPRADSGHLTTTTEYVLVYAKSKVVARTQRLGRKASSDSRYANPDGDPDGAWREANLTARSPSRSSQYAIQSPFTGALHYPPNNRSWAQKKSNIRAWLSEWGTEYVETDIGDGRGRALMVAGGSEGQVPEQVKKASLAKLANGPYPFIWFGMDGEGRPRSKTHLSKVKKGAVPVTYWADDDELPLEIGAVSWQHEESGRSSDGVAELTAIVGEGHGFTTVKPMKLMQKIIQLWCPPTGLVLDVFAGSGTTAHALLSLNMAQGADRRFIMVEQGRPEKGDSYARTLTADRLKRVVEGNWAAAEGYALGGGFTFQTLTKQVDGKTLLLMERDEMTDTVIASHTGTARKRGIGLVPVGDEGEYRFLVARNSVNEGIFLIWTGSLDNMDLTEDVYEDIVDEAERAGLARTYHVYSRLNLYVTEDVVWYQIPDRILQDFGLDVRSDVFTEEATGT